MADPVSIAGGILLSVAALAVIAVVLRLALAGYVRIMHRLFWGPDAAFSE